MNRGEAIGLGGILAVIVFVIFMAVWYFIILDNLIVVSEQLGYDLIPVKDQVWWMAIGFGILLMMRGGTKGFKWARRDYCDHCGKELKK